MAHRFKVSSFGIASGLLLGCFCLPSSFQEETPDSRLKPCLLRRTASIVLIMRKHLGARRSKYCVCVLQARKRLISRTVMAL